MGPRYNQLFATMTMVRWAQGFLANMPAKYTSRDNLIAHIVQRKLRMQLAHGYFQSVPRKMKTDLPTIKEFLATQEDYFKNSQFGI
jgi:hypothetical protein